MQAGHEWPEWPQGITGEQLRQAAERDPVVRRLLSRILSSDLYTWQPRPDDPQNYDEQTAFVQSKLKFAILLGGTGAGKTVAAAYKTARYLLDNPPPRADCPFWIIGESYQLVGEVCWKEKLSKFIPKSEIKSIHWMNSRRGWPYAVMLNNGWTIEFKSYAQGREAMQAASIGGFWFNEEAPWAIVEEVMGRCRDYDSPGWADFTPIDCKDPEWPEIYDDDSRRPANWQFFHVNSEKNFYLAEGWAENFLKYSVSADMRETRRIGAFASFRGAVYKEWRRMIHVIDPDDPRRQQQFPWLDPEKEDYGIPPDWKRARGIDFGYNNPFVCLWGAIDEDGRWYIYDEHYAAQTLIAEHARAIKKRRWPKNHPSYGPTFADHDSQDRAELQSHGIGTVGARKEVHAGLETVRQSLIVQPDGRPRLYVFARCVNLIREIRAYKWREGTDKKDPMELPLAKDDHSVDALRYIAHTWKSWNNDWDSSDVKPLEKEWMATVGRRFLG